MSTAKNHAKRSHRSNFRSRAWNGGRRAVIKPTISKAGAFSLMQMIRKALSRNKETKGDIE